MTTSTEIVRELEYHEIEVLRFVHDPSRQAFEGAGYSNGVPGTFRGSYAEDDFTIRWTPNVVMDRTKWNEKTHSFRNDPDRRDYI